MTLSRIVSAALAVSLVAGCLVTTSEDDLELVGQVQLASEEGESAVDPPGDCPAEPDDGEPPNPDDDEPYPSPISDDPRAPFDQGQSGTCGYTALLNAELKFDEVDLQALAAFIDACLENTPEQRGGPFAPVFKEGGIKTAGGSAHWNAFLACKTAGLAAQGVQVEFEESGNVPTTNHINHDAPKGDDDRTYTKEQVESAVKKLCEDVEATLMGGGTATMDYRVGQLSTEHVVTVLGIICEPSGGMSIVVSDPNDPARPAMITTDSEGKITACTPPEALACKSATGHSDNRILRALHERRV